MSNDRDTEVQRLIAEAMAPLQKRIAGLGKRVVGLGAGNTSLKNEAGRAFLLPALRPDSLRAPAGGGGTGRTAGAAVDGLGGLSQGHVPHLVLHDPQVAARRVPTDDVARATGEGDQQSGRGDGRGL